MTTTQALTIADAERLLGEPAERWVGRCYEIASRLAEHVGGRPAYGHWRGPVHRDSLFAYARTVGFARHGWLAMPDGTVCDPTRWTFTLDEPSIYFGPADHYDEGGNVWRESQSGPPPVFTGEAHPIELAPWEADFVATLLGQSVPQFTIAQLMWIAHRSPHTLGDFAQPIYEALDAAGLRAFVPLDNWRMVEAGAHAFVTVATCALCGAETPTDSRCYGCASYICDAHSRDDGDEPLGPHRPEDHES